MITLPNYQITDLLHEGTKRIVCRGYRNQDKTPVILKILKTDYPSISDIAQLKHEYEIVKHLDIAGVVKSYGLENYRNRFFLVLEDTNSQDLEHFLKTSVPGLHRCLNIAIELITIIGELHHKQIIHKDIKPRNVIINPEIDQVKLIDFSIASRLSKENPAIISPNLFEGTLAYISPEQTGRMNRAIDYRTDFYSFGVTLYEMLTGQLPFQVTDPMELVHCHIARQPMLPNQLKAEIPEVLSNIVMKLLAKTAEERYQSANGIKADLEVCLTQLTNFGKVAPFTLAQNDLAQRFEIPQKLYGREAEVNTLMTAFDRVSQGTTEMMIVAGYSGIGKSALVNEIHKPIVRQRGYFIAGKFDQYKRNIPYTSLIQAFRELIGQLLTETESRIATWKQKLLAALGTNAQVIVDVIPEVELIIGPQPPVAQLPPSEAQNRFNLVFKNFIHVFTQQEHPLVMFLDDLQWADSASLKLIEILITDPDSQYLFMIGAYRDNEVSPTHPLIMTLGDITSNGATVNAITLEPLAFVHINQLVADTVLCSLEQAQPLAELVQEKTAGNPFFLTQLMRHLYLENFLHFNFATAQWEWTIDDLKTIDITDNVVELMVSKIEKLPEPTQNILKLAACVGNAFDLAVLAVVHGTSQSTAASTLWDALTAGLIVPLSDAYKIPQVLEDFAALTITYKFLHDRVQQAAYSMIPQERKQDVHLQVGRLLLGGTAVADLEENIFDIVNQLNIGVELIADPLERYELADLNLRAARRAKAATAYESALKYLTAGLDLLAADSWQSHYDLTLNLHVEAVEVQYLNTDFDAAQSLSDVVFEQARNLLHQVKVYEFKIQFHIAQNQMLEAIDTALPIVELLGYPLSQEPSDLRLIATLPELSDLPTFPEMTDPSQLAVLQILTIITGPAYQSKPDLLPYIVFKMVNLCLEFGHSSLAAYAYGMYGLMLCGPLQDIATGYHAGQLSLRILEQCPDPALSCKIHMLFNSFVGHWKEHHRQTVPAFADTIQMGLETGDMVYAAYCCMWSCGYLMLTGDTLDTVAERQQQYVDLLDKSKQEHGLYPAKTWRQLTLNLQGAAPDRLQLNGESFNQADLQRLEVIQNGMLLFFVYFAKLILAYFFRDYSAAVTHTERAAEYAPSATASMLAGGYIFYDALARLALYPDLDSKHQKDFLEHIESNQAKMRDWAEHAPMNYASKYALVEAEKARVLGQALAAMAHYDRAIALAQEHGYLQEVAIASERAAEFYQALGRDRFAQLYLSDACYAYERWGATAKVEALQQAHPQRIIPGARVRDDPLARSLTATTATTVSGAGILDLNTVIKSSQVISGEIVLEKLVAKLLQLAIENAGAQRGLLMLLEDNRLKIEAVGSVDQGEMEVMQSFDVERSQDLPLSMVQYVQRTHKDVVLSDATHEGGFTGDLYIASHQPKSVLCAPIIDRGTCIGILYLENNLTTGAFTNDRLEVLKMLSSQAAISLENAILYRTLEDKVDERTAQLAAANAEIHTLNAQLQAENLRLGAELEVTRKLQRMLLPTADELKQIDGLDIACYMDPADEVGGDYYDVLQHNGQVKIGIGDVTGHGLESGVLTVMTQAAVRALLTSGETDPVRFLDTLNRTLYNNTQRMGADKNLTLSLLDYADGNLTLSGQHEEMIVVRQNGEVELVDTVDLGFPLALVDEIAGFIHHTTVRLQPGDGVALYTDGITEADNIDGEQYGQARLCEVLREHWAQPVEAIVDAVVADVRRHIGEQVVYDDITLVVVKQQ